VHAFVCILYSVNCPTIICSPSMLFILWRDTSSELWTPGPFFYIHITVYYLLALFTFLQTTIFYHTIRLILCLQQIGEIDNLTVSWGKVLWLCCVQVPRCCWCKATPQIRCHIQIVWSCREASEHQPSEVGSFSYWFDKPRFHTEGRLAVVLIIPSSWGSQLGA
jgi:hypothetical protein